MKQPHIAFVSVPAPPHVNPTLAVVSVLIRRGYRVTYVTSERFAPRVSATGAEVITCPLFPELTPPDSHDALESNAFCRLAEGTLIRALPFYTENRPDIIVSDFLAIAGRIIANKLKVPSVQMSPTFAHNNDPFSEQLKSAEFRELTLVVSHQIDKFLELNGVESKDFIFHREALNIYFFPREFQPNASILKEECLFAGRCPGEQPYYGSWQKPPTSERPIALISTSTTYAQGSGYFRMCIDAFSPLNWHVLLSIGDTVTPDSVGPLPQHFEIVQRTSHLRVLPYASLFLCLGGIISMAEAAYHGVPLIVMTQGLVEMEWQANCVAGLGTGVWLNEASTTVDRLSDAIIAIPKDEVILGAVRKLRSSVRRSPGSEDVANYVETYMDYAS
jgi:MGT family glycosyltransferase